MTDYCKSLKLDLSGIRCEYSYLHYQGYHGISRDSPLRIPPYLILSPSPLLPYPLPPFLDAA